MAFKLIAFFTCVAIASAGLLPSAADQAEKDDYYDPHPQYSFNYDVQDNDTGDYKSQTETRDGDVIKGQYTVQDPDGYRRIVDYSADAESGFKAVVHRERLTSKTIPSLPASVPAPELSPIKTVIPPQPPTLAPLPKPLKLESVALKPVVPSTAYISTYAAPADVVHHAPTTHTVVHHTPTHALYHAAPAVHLAPTAHFVHSSAPAGTLLKTAPALITTTTHHHHTAPAVVRTSFSAPHISYVY